MTDLVDGSDVRAAGQYLITSLSTVADDSGRWDVAAGGLRWSCRKTLAHIIGACYSLSSLLARRATGPTELLLIVGDRPVPILLDLAGSATAVLAEVVSAAGPADRARHPWGVADRSGFAAMGVDEVLVHGGDIAAGLGVYYAPPPDLCLRVGKRLFPWTPAADGEADPWTALLWATGRTPLGSTPAQASWRPVLVPHDE